MRRKDGTSPAGGQWAEPPGKYSPAQSSDLAAPGQQYLSPPKKKRSTGRRILSALVAVAVFITVRIVVHALMADDSHQSSGPTFDYAIGTCLDLSKAGSFVKPSDVHEALCSSPTALSKVASKYKGSKNCPGDHYGTLESGGSGLCLQDNLTVGSCYREQVLSHMFKLSECAPRYSDPNYKVALRRDGVNDPGLCASDQLAVHFPEPPLTYCLDALLIGHGDTPR